MAGRTDPARSLPAPAPVRVRFGTFELDEVNARLLRGDTPVAVAPTPFAVLCALARQPGSLLTKQMLLDQVWGHQFVSDSVLKTAISDLRTILDDDPRQPRFIETVSRKGYRFIAPASAVHGAPSGARSHAESPSLPARCFVGRAEALSRLHSAWNLSCAGTRRMVWVAGEPGIGKTTLIEHFVGDLGDVACARGQCVEHYGPGEPYLPVLEALAELARGDSALPNLLRTVAPTWMVQLPWLSSPEERDGLRRELTGVAPDRMLREFAELVDRYTERTPLLLATEDLHWSDRATIQLINYIARRRGKARIMWLASFRLAEVVGLDHPLNSLRHEMRLHDLCEEIVLDPFSETEVADYVAKQASLLGTDESFVRALHERTDGVPLFVASVLNDIMTRRSERGGGGAEPKLDVAAVPENLAAIIDHYIARLGSDERTLLSAAAVCGVSFRITTLALVLGRDASELVGTCEELVRNQLWLVHDRADARGTPTDLIYSFRHALFRHVLYERTAAPARLQLHGKVGRALEGQRASGAIIAAGELATHFERARELLSALSYHAEAAESALANFAPSECIDITERALALLPDAPHGTQRDSLEISLRTLCGLSMAHALGFGADTKAVFQGAYALLDRVPRHPICRRLLHGYGFALSLRTEYADALAVADRAEALSRENDDPLLGVAASIVHGEVDQVQGRSRAARAWIDHGLAIAELPEWEAAGGELSVADPQVTLRGLLAIELLHAGSIQQGQAELLRAHSRAEELKQPMARLVAIWFSALFEVRLRKAERVAALADQMRALVEEHGVAQGAIAWRWFRGWADAHLGKAHEGYRAIREACEDNVRIGMLAGMGEVLAYATEALLLAGDLDGAQRQLEEALQFCDAHGERVYLPELLLTAGAIARARGDSDATRAAIRGAVEEARAQEVPWLEITALVDLCATRHASAEDRDALAALIDRLPDAVGTEDRAKVRTLLEVATKNKPTSRRHRAAGESQSH